MVSIALGVFILAIIYVAVWNVVNDDVPSIRDQKGLIRMRVPPGDDTAEAGSRRGVRRATRSSRERGFLHQGRAATAPGWLRANTR